jgi:hypothetical protein
MARMGFGAGRFRRMATGHTSPARETLASLAPGDNWNGTAASGFAAIPLDPVRTTAKPAMRILVPPNQAFTDELLVGVYAGANNRGSLMDNMGLEKVVVHYEGATAEIARPAFQTFDDANGNPVTYWGWWAKLRHNGVNGVATVYFEAVPKDSAMQHRVTGPFTFLPSAALYDFDVAIDPDSPPVADVSYQTIQAAMLRFAVSARQRGCARFVKAGTYDIPPYGGAYTMHKGWFEISADVPVTIAKTPATKAQMRPQFDRIRFRGANLTLDTRYISEFRPQTSSGGNAGFWFDGVTIINSGGRNELWDKRARDIFLLSRNLPFFTECTLSGVVLPFSGAYVVRGCDISSGGSDFATGTVCVVGNRIDDWSSDFYKEQIPALTVQYLGAGAAATLSISGSNGAPTRTWTARVDGATVGAFTVQNTNPALATYNVRNIADWLNTLAGFSATLLDDTRDATHCGPPGVVGTAGAAMADQDVKTAPWTAITVFDFHVDWWQKPIAGNLENVVIADNLATGVNQGANIFINGDEARDYLIVNNALGNTDIAGKASQLIADQSHVVIAHNNITQPLNLRANLDAYSLVANNVVESWGEYQNGDQARIVGNHLTDAASDYDAGFGAGTTRGGDKTSLFADAASGDFSPAGALLANLRPPVIKYGRNRVARGAAAAAGAVA